MWFSLKNTITQSHRCLQSGLDVLFPKVCPLCAREEEEEEQQQPTSADEVVSLFCSDCHAQLLRDTRAQCLRCGAPVGPNLPPQAGCTHCQKDNFRFRHVYALGLYDELLKAAILKAKQPGTEPLAIALLDTLWERKQLELQNLHTDIVVPVPQHWLERITRAHHSPTTIGQQLAKQLRVEYASQLLYKSRRTAKQSSLTPTERRKNLLRAFKVRKGTGIADAKILLVDDVLTTGSTANEVAKTLRQAGAKEVNVVVIARGIGHPTAMKTAVT